MAGESLAIIIVLLVTAVMYLRVGKQEMAGLTIPFACLPVMYLVGVFLFAPVIRNTGRTWLPFVFIAAGALLGVILFTVLSLRLSTRRNRIGYAVIGCGFTVALGIAYVLNVL